MGGLCQSGEIAGRALTTLKNVILGDTDDFFGGTIIEEHCDATEEAAGNTYSVFACSSVMMLANVMMLSAISAGKARINAFLEEKSGDPVFPPTGIQMSAARSWPANRSA